MTTFDIEVTRDGRWWMIRVPALAGHVSAEGAMNLSDTTQARDRGEIDTMARDFIATVLDLPVDDIAVQRVEVPSAVRPQ